MTTIQHSSPLHFPSTPVASHQSRYPVLAPNFRPINSSPLASPSSPKSPVVVAQARRRSQYKARTPSTPVASSSKLPSARAINSSGGSVFYSGSATSTPVQDPQKSFLREKFKAKCFARAAKAREKAIRGRRYDLSSDGFDDAMDDEDEEDDGDDSIMDDELFRRIMSNVSRKTRHSYRVSYALDVGSSFDPDIEDVNEWERELTGTHTDSSQSAGVNITDELTPVDLEDEELEAYAEECAKRAALADFEDIAEEDLFSWSDLEIEEVARGLNEMEDVDMEL